MGLLDFRFYRGGVHLPELKLWLDAHEAIGPEELVFVSHAHSDHTGRHARVLFTPPTQALMRSRVSGQRAELVVPFGERIPLPGFPEVAVTLLPAGHILGSAMILIEAAGRSLLYTGDFKLRHGLAAEVCEPRHADVLIMETTFGLPKYVFPPSEEVLKGIVRYCREALDHDEIPVLLGYSLGKSQEMLRGLADSGLAIMVHPQAAKMTAIYSQFGMPFPAYRELDAAKAANHVVLAPPGVSLAALQQHHPALRTAMLTGWALDSGAQFQYRAGKAFPLSDHADFPDLLEFVRQVGPSEVFTLHGFAAEFAGTLRELGLAARALGQDEQLELGLANPPAGSAPKPPAGAVTIPPAPVPPAEPGSFAGFAHCCAALSATRSKPEKLALLAAYLQLVPKSEIPGVVAWFGGHLSSSLGRPPTVGWAALRPAICSAAGIDGAALQQACLHYGDPAEAAGAVIAGKASDPSQQVGFTNLSLSEVTGYFSRLAQAPGALQKRPLLGALFQRCSGVEARFLVKLFSGDLRIGLKETLLEAAIASAFGVSTDEVQTVHALSGDLGETARLASLHRLGDANLRPFRPIRPMQAASESNPAATVELLRGWLAQPGKAEDERPVFWIENEMGSIRCHAHKCGNDAALFSEDLKNITEVFPELAATLRRLPFDVILDGEVLALEDGKVVPLAKLEKRIGQRQDDLFAADGSAVRFVAFDLLWVDGTALINESLGSRRARLEAMELPAGLELAAVRRLQALADVDAAIAEMRVRGTGGLTIKNSASLYTAGHRSFSWLSLQPLKLSSS